MIKFDLPDGNASVLHHIGEALQNIAADLRGDTELQAHMHVPLVQQINRGQRTTSPDVEVDTVSQQYASLAKDSIVKREGPFYWSHSESGSYGMVDTETELEALFVDQAVEITEDMYNVLLAEHGDIPPSVVETVVDVTDEVEPVVDNVAGVETDVNGLPWDKRIHSANRTKNADKSWRNARQPKAFEGDWSEYVKSIEAELHGAMTTEDTPPPPVAEMVVDNTPPPPVEESTPFNQTVTQDVPPPPPSDNLEPKTFPELMKLITENAKEKGSVKLVQEIIAAHNYGSLQTLNSVGPEAVTIVYHELKAML